MKQISNKKATNITRVPYVSNEVPLRTWDIYIFVQDFITNFF